MAYTYTPAYYSTIHDSITSICKTILPFSFKKKRLTSAEHRFSKLQSDNLKWQQDSFHQILNLMGLHKEGILSENEVSAFKTHLLETLIASPLEHEQAVILRDKLVFLQELLYAKCISEDEYHSSKRPLLQRLAVQGAEIDSRDVIVAGPKDTKEKIEEEWSDIDLKDEKSLYGKETLQSRNRSKPNSAMKQITGAASVLGFGSAHKLSKHKEKRSIFEIEARLPSSGQVSNERENPLWDSNLKDKESETKSILMQASLPNESVKESASNDKPRRKPFKTLFQQQQREGDGGGGGDNGLNCVEKTSKSAKKPWGFDGFKKWKKNDSDDETAPLPLNNERSDSEAYSGSCHLVNSPIGEGPDTKQIKKKLHSNGSSSDFFIDKVLGDKIKKELSKIQTELSTTNPSLKFSDDQIEAISTKLPVDKGDLKKFFPKSWCDRYGDVVLDVVKKEFKDHVGDMENMRNVAREKHHNNSKRWTTFEDEDENCHPNLFSRQDHHSFPNNKNFTAKNDNSAYTNPFSHDSSESNNGNKLMTESFQNPFWGVLFVVADTDSTTEELGEFMPSMKLRQLIPTVDTNLQDISRNPLLLLQVTSFKCGGVCLGVGWHHTLADGTGALHFINSWATLARGLSITIPPLLDRTILRGRVAPKSIFHHVEYDPPPTMNTDLTKTPKPQSLTNLKITLEQINSLKAKASNVGSEAKYTTYEILTAHIWRSVSKARNFQNNDQETKLRISVDGRSRLNPPLQASYFGNVIFTASPVALSCDLLSESFRCTVERIHREIKKMDDEYLRSALDYLEEVGDINSIPRGTITCACPNLNVVSWMRLPIYKSDFGWGAPLLLRPATMFEGKGYIHPSPANDGSFSLAICLEADHMESFRKLFYDF